jgi:hypothetical protein
MMALRANIKQFFLVERHLRGKHDKPQVATFASNTKKDCELALQRDRAMDMTLGVNPLN